MRDLLVSGVLFALLPLSFRKPFIGLMIFSLLAYMRVQDLTWGFARGIRWSFYFAIVTFAGFFVTPQGRRFMANDVRNLIMVLMATLVGLSIVLTGGPRRGDMPVYTEYLKIIVIALFTTGLVDTRERLRVMIWVIAFSFAFYGFKSGLVGILTGGGLVILQGPGGMLQDNNDFALALSMGIPMMWHIAQSEKSEPIRRALVACVPLTMITVALTHSRGGFLSMATAISVLIWRSRNRAMGLVAGAAIVLVALIAAPSSWKDRISSIQTYDEDGSAQARLAAWRTAGVMIAANPLFGVGFNNFQDSYFLYDPAIEDASLHQSSEHVAHNSYLQIWAECGTPAFALYMALILLSFIDVWNVRAAAKRRYHSSWILNYCTMFEASTATFLIGSTFLNRAHFDLFYHWVAIVVCFGRIARREMRDELKYPRRSVGRRGTLRPVEAAGFGRRAAPADGFRSRPALS